MDHRKMVKKPFFEHPSKFYAAVKLVIFQKNDFFKQNRLSIHVFGPKLCAEFKKMGVELIFSHENYVLAVFWALEGGMQLHAAVKVVIFQKDDFFKQN